MKKASNYSSNVLKLTILGVLLLSFGAQASSTPNQKMVINHVRLSLWYEGLQDLSLAQTPTGQSREGVEELDKALLRYDKETVGKIRSTQND